MSATLSTKAGSYFSERLLEQSFPCFPGMQVHCPVVRSHCPFPVQDMSPMDPGHGISKTKKKIIDI